MKHNMFTGWKEIFSFTFTQNTKTKAFKTAFFGIGVLIFVIFFAINIITGYVKDSKKDKTNSAEDKISNLYILNETEVDNSEFEKFDAGENTKLLVEGKADIAAIIDELNKSNESGVVIRIYEGEEVDETRQFMLDVYSTDGLSKSCVKDIAKKTSKYFDGLKYSMTTLEAANMNILMSDLNVYSMDIEDDDSIGEVLAKIFVPMIFVLVIYMMILMYGQSISKSLIVEKNSKLMEMLLISVKPYAIVLGKILAMYVIAILQMAFWVIMGVSGFAISDKVAQEMFDRYSNPITSLMDMMKEGSSSAFTIQSIAVGILAMLAGFLLYCVFAGLVSSNITKAEELANGMSVYQMVVVVGFLGAYMLPLMQSESPIVKIIRFIPITSPYMVTSDVIVGNMGIVQAIISIMIMFASIFAMIIATGKIYKKKVF